MLHERPAYPGTIHSRDTRLMRLTDLRFILWTALFFTLVASLGVVGVYAYRAKELPDYTQLDCRRVFQTVRMVDSKNELLGEFTDPVGGRSHSALTGSN